MSRRPVADTKKRMRLLLLAAVFAAPMVLAYVLFYSGWRPTATGAHGELVTPAHPVADVELKRLDGESVPFSSLRPRWTLVYFGASECAAACERALYHMRQVIAAQGREAHRVHSAMVLTDTRALAALRGRLKEYPDTTVFTGPREAVLRLAREFELPAGSALAGMHRIYLVDPLGNLMMSYTAGVDPSGVRKDLARLLRYSQVG
jgi:cytochrome oxidase Cu insertion factor (SCO1/SenC/PrrC family)